MGESTFPSHGQTVVVRAIQATDLATQNFAAGPMWINKAKLPS